MSDLATALGTVRERIAKFHGQAIGEEAVEHLAALDHLSDREPVLRCCERASGKNMVCGILPHNGASR